MFTKRTHLPKIIFLLSLVLGQRPSRCLSSKHCEREWDSTPPKTLVVHWTDIFPAICNDETRLNFSQIFRANFDVFEFQTVGLSATDKMNGKGKLRPRPIKSVSQLKPAWPTRPTFHPSNPTIIFELSRHTGTCHLVVRKAKPDLLVMARWGWKPILHHHAIVKNPISRLCHGGF